MEKELIVYEPNMNSSPHSEINTGLLSVFEKVFPRHIKFFYADKRHIKYLKRKRDITVWDVRYLKTFDYTPILFLLNDIFLILKIRKILKRHKNANAIFFFLGIMPLAQNYLSKYNTKHKRNITICLHGQMEAYLENTAIGFSKHYYRISKKSFSQDDNIKYLIFGESIKEKIKFLFRDENKTLVIDQPYIFDKNIIRNPTANNNIILGIIGRADKTKNIKELFNLIEIIKDEILNNRITIKIIGKFEYDYPKKYEGLFTYYTNRLEQDVFDRELNSVDFALSFTGKDYYKATPSGVFFDCIKWEIPLITLHNDFTDYYFNKYGAMGKSFNSTSEMGMWITNDLVVKGIAAFINEANFNFKKVKEAISLNSLAEILSSQL